MDDSRMPREGRLAAAATFGCIAAAISYALIRLVEFFFMPEPNPGIVIWSARSGYVWRLALSIYLGGAFGGLAWALSGTAARQRALVRALSALVIGSLLLVLVQGLICP